MVHLTNTPSGQFRSCRVPRRFTDGLGDDVKRFLHHPDHPGRMSWVSRYYADHVEPHLEAHLADAGYHGPLGVDAFVYRDVDGALKLRPVVEVNPRFTMGRLALAIARRLPRNPETTLEVVPLRHYQPGQPHTVPLNDPSRARRFVATVSTA
jgi:hypothetical protein